MLCEKCGKEAKPGDVFCRQCGSRLAGEEQAAAEEGGAAAEEGAPEAETAAGEPAAAALLPPTPPPAPTPPYPPAAPKPRAVKTSAWAVASLVLGILSFLCLPFIAAIVAIVFGAIAKRGIKDSRGEMGGSGLATTGIVLGIVNLSILLILAAFAVPWTIINIGSTQTVTRTVATQGADSVNATLDMDSGELNVGGGASDMFKGTFTYNVKRWEPEIEYGVRQGQGELSIRQGGSWWLPNLWFIRNEWDVSFKDNIPLDLSARLSSADSYFDLRTLSLRSLDVDVSSGAVSADLSGDLPDLRSVSIDGSSGNVNLDMKGRYQTYIQLDVDVSSGNIDLDLLGDWESALSASIEASSGNVVINIPEDVGVRVRASTSSGDIKAPGMKVDSEDGDGAVYVNDAFRNAVITLQIDVEVSSGNISLLLEE
ncbi:MAG: DUF4190 domain-containing protein [Actinobacteria bacterium]|nr:DUF4190 domain-containing protein [Actinomycetota bacterium]